MRLYGGVSSDDGFTTSIKGMHLQTQLLAISDENINNFGKIGYQRKIPVVSSFTQYLGANALSEVKDNAVGRIRTTGNSLDFALAKNGYFQYQTPNGVELTRDGRFKLDKNGYMLTQTDFKVLSSNGQPIKFKVIPNELKDIKVGLDGTITSMDPDKKESYKVGKISVVSDKGSIASEIDVRQGCTEDSNVRLESEIYGIVPVRRNFEANRQLFILQNSELSKVIQELGRSS